MRGSTESLLKKETTRSVHVASRLSLRAPSGFNFWRTVISHGWCSLPPFKVHTARRELERTLRLTDGTIVHCRLNGKGRSVTIRVASTQSLTTNQREDISQQLTTCLRLGEDLSPFHAEARKHPHYVWIAATRSGRLLRAPSIFEDAVKMICTTNCTWALTTLMVTNLVERYGERFNHGVFSFPTPSALAASTENELRKDCKTGYRAPYLLQLAERVATGALPIEAWSSSMLSTEVLFKELRNVKGIGPYAAANLLKLLGRYDYLGLDSWVRAKYYELHRRGRKVKDATIERHYAPYGKWRGLFFWLEMTKSWHDGKFEL